jgi:hypothetical protein
MRVQVTGISPGTYCRFWAITRNGQRSPAGSWTVISAAYGGSPWFSASAKVSPGSIRSFQITAGGQTLVSIPAS